MAPPDLSSLPPRGTSQTTSTSNNAPPDQANTRRSRRTSSVMGPPPVPTNSSLPNSPRPPNAAMANLSATSQGPIRHPRPLTAAELHLELEKEQESIVNRLTRELSALRAQTASVASTASSTSDLFTSSQTQSEYPYIPPSSSYGGASIIPTSARRHRSSSNLSTRSARSAREGIARDANTTSVSGVAAPRDSDRSHQTSARQSLDIQRERPETSRQNSYNLGLSTSGSNMHRSTSNATSPYGPPAGYNYSHPHRPSTSASHSRNPSQQGLNSGLGIAQERSPSFSSATAAARYEEAAVQRQELETVKKENEALKQRIRDLERQLLAGNGAETPAAT